ncbi:MAG: fumarylacetoacetate hydrolase family protein [Ramlibacter sp.]|jgi:fumarylacetoacetate (FAA) hydrolase|uniref:fumarylacetoacetate hydrolase family protein n=1 Tax=Ramlibacter sp. TaxID=1917967 RepID=UPI002609AD0B|nr:fumarylacetoacetate hydrolase family protein [Ramlibacter sp.]MDH4376114.1 fumarylacetoacetate hydrolase family protein [Ramlibacter sp.]
MKLATLANNTPDGQLVVLSTDGLKCASAQAIAPSLQAALERWQVAEPALRELAAALDAGRCGHAQPFDAAHALAPLPRAWQWLDGSAFQSHGDLMDVVFKIEKKNDPSRPLMYQGLSNQFIAPGAEVPLPSADDAIDFEGEFGVITDAVPMGTPASEARAHIRLVVLINDWSLRRLAPVEMKTGFGWIQAKPACSMAPIAVTPDELGAGWRDARVQMRLEVDWNGQRFGAAHGGAMGFGFDALVAHAAYSRDLVAGTVIGSGTVSNPDYRSVGSSCIAERRAIETLDLGEPRTPFMAFGDRVRMQARHENGQDGPFGAIEQTVVQGATGRTRP